MIHISLENINQSSPYEVSPLGEGYTFVAENGVVYSVHFTEEFAMGDCETYQFMFSKLTNRHAPFDHNISQTLIVIIVERTNPKLQAVLDDFDRSAKELAK